MHIAQNGMGHKMDCLCILKINPTQSTLTGPRSSDTIDFNDIMILTLTCQFTKNCLCYGIHCSSVVDTDKIRILLICSQFCDFVCENLMHVLLYCTVAQATMLVIIGIYYVSYLQILRFYFVGQILIQALAVIAAQDSFLYASIIYLCE